MQSNMGTGQDLDYDKGLVINYREGRRLINGRGDNFTHTFYAYKNGVQKVLVVQGGRGMGVVLT